MVNHTQDFVAVKKYEILQYSLIPSAGGLLAIDYRLYNNINTAAADKH